MNESHKKTTLVSVFSSVLILSFYGRVSWDACLALVLSSGLLVFLCGVMYFLRLWLSAAWVRTIVVVLASSAAQIVWIKQGLEPWWVLAALSLLLPVAPEIREPVKISEFTVKAIILETTALCFFVTRSALELTASRYFWEQPAGHLGLLGLIAVFVGVLARLSPSIRLNR